MKKEPTVPPLVFDPLPVIEVTAGDSGSSTAKVALEMLTTGDLSFRKPTKEQRRNLAMAFAADERIVYGKAFDAVRVPAEVAVDLDDLASVEEHLAKIILYEIKSSRRSNLGENFKGYFFALTAAELLVAQSLGPQFRFLLINTLNGERLELTLQDLLTKARSIYPSWSVLF